MNDPRSELPPVGGLVTLADRSVYLSAAGGGSPVAVFLPGAGMFGLGYHNVQMLIAEHTTAVIYDRGGTGWSDAVALPRSATEVARELEEVLRAASLPGPYLLIGHSLGGLYARRFAQLFPSATAAILLLDPGHEDLEDNLPEPARSFSQARKGQPVPELTREMVEGYRPIMMEMYGSWPENLRNALIERHLDPARVKVGLLEASNIDDLSAEMRRAGPTPAVPLIVYTATGLDATQTVFQPEAVARAQNEAKLVTNAAFVKTVPGAEHRVLEDASHLMIHTRRPDAVVAGVRDLLQRIRP